MKNDSKGYIEIMCKDCQGIYDFMGCAICIAGSKWRKEHNLCVDDGRENLDKLDLKFQFINDLEEGDKFVDDESFVWEVSHVSRIKTAPVFVVIECSDLMATKRIFVDELLDYEIAEVQDGK